MKKLTAVLLIALALTLCLTGCGGEKKQNESGNGACCGFHHRSSVHKLC